MVSWSEMPRSPGHVFYDRLQSVLIEGGFDAFAEASCRPYYAVRMGAPSVPPGRYFRMHLVGYFEGIDSERGLEWRCSDSLSLRAFLRLGSRDRVPDHSWLSRSCTRLPHEVHAAVFDWVLVLIAEAGLKDEAAHCLRLNPDVSVKWAMEVVPYEDPGRHCGASPDVGRIARRRLAGLIDDISRQARSSLQSNATRP